MSNFSPDKLSKVSRYHMTHCFKVTLVSRKVQEWNFCLKFGLLLGCRIDLGEKIIFSQNFSQKNEGSFGKKTGGDFLHPVYNGLGMTFHHQWWLSIPCSNMTENDFPALVMTFHTLFRYDWLVYAHSQLVVFRPCFFFKPLHRLKDWPAARDSIDSDNDCC